MEVKKRVVFILAWSFVLLFPIVDAEIFVGQPQSLYNIGDDFYMNITMRSETVTNAFFVANIVCAERDIEVYRSPYYINTGERKSISLRAKLDPFLIQDLRGDCFLRATYGDSSVESQHFTLTDEVQVVVTLNSTLINPGEVVRVSGTARKLNGKVLDGFIMLSISELNVSSGGEVRGGNFLYNLLLPSYAPAGSYVVHAKAYEKNRESEITNTGESGALLTIRQVVRSIDIALSDYSVHPGGEMIYTVLLFDQSGREMKQEVEIIVTAPNNTMLLKRLAMGGEMQRLQFPTGAAPMLWVIEARAGEVRGTRSFSVLEVVNASFSLSNNTLTVKNTGNVPYKKSVEIIIGSYRTVRDIMLEPEELKKYILEAPDSNYPIVVDDGSGSLYLGESYLTGNAIGVRELNTFFGNKAPLIFWIIVFIIVAFIAFLYYQRKKPFIRGKPSFKPLVHIVGASPAHAAHGGFRDEVVVLALHIKNKPALQNSKEAQASIDSSLEEGKRARANIYHQVSYILMLFSPKLLKEENVLLRVVHLARTIEGILHAYNRKHVFKISYGIGVHVGEMIIEVKEGKPKFTAVGNTLVSAKMATERANNVVIISHKVQSELHSVVKSEPLPGGNFYKVLSVINRAQHNEFIERFMKRQGR